MSSQPDTRETNEHPPRGDVQPVPVHITGIEAAAAIRFAPEKKAGKKRTSRLATYVLTTANPVQPILPEAPNRVHAYIMVRALIGGAANAGSYGWIGSNQSIVTQAASAHGEGSIEGAIYVSAGGTINGFDVYGTDAVWASIDGGATVNLTISVISDYED